jgi:hypothetical protein
MEYAFPRSNEFHFATASIVSKTGVKPPPFWTCQWFAAFSGVAIQRFAKPNWGTTQSPYGILSLI